MRKRERWSVSKGNGEDKEDNEIMMIEECIRWRMCKKEGIKVLIIIVVEGIIIIIEIVCCS